ncbi:MAG: ankyrin repeat domain-containing protein [Chthoniobacter sp.]|uniref:ankyrin repeat domain-containing protein n=1 Tax=Chthoniobacter sp. TaxID=2510640 RepID=UPI0032ACE5F5
MAFAPVAMAEDESEATASAPAFKMRAAEGRDLFRIALTNEDASAKDFVMAQLRTLDLPPSAVLVQAITAGHPQLIQLLLTTGCNVNGAGEQGKTPLLAAAQAHNWELVAQLLKAGADPRIADEKGMTPLMAAAIGGHGPTIEKLLAAGAPVDAADSKGRLALGYAVATKQPAAVAVLLDHQRTLPVAARGGDDLAAAALESGDRNLFEDILRRLPGGLTWTPAARTEFSKALAAKDTILGPLLMEKFAGAPAASAHAQPLLAYAIASHNAAQVQTLLNLGADPNTVLDQPGDIAFREWVGNNFMRYYLDTTQGLNVLMLAAGMKQADTVKLLLDCGANRNACSRGKSSLIALYFAAWADSPETIQVLLGDAPSKDEVRIEVSLDEQRARYYRSGQLILTATISTGRDGFATKPGEYVITDKHLEHHSTLYHNASMPFFMRLSCQAFGLHEGVVTGRPASHGCIRLPGEVARRLFKEAPVGTWVSIKR